MWGLRQHVDRTQGLPMSWLGFSYAPGYLPCRANPGALETGEKSAEDSEQGIQVYNIQTPSRPSLLSNRVGGGSLQPRYWTALEDRRPTPASRPGLPLLGPQN